MQYNLKEEETSMTLIEEEEKLMTLIEEEETSMVLVEEEEEKLMTMIESTKEEDNDAVFTMEEEEVPMVETKEEEDAASIAEEDVLRMAHFQLNDDIADWVTEQSRDSFYLSETEIQMILKQVKRTKATASCLTDISTTRQYRHLPEPEGPYGPQLPFMSKQHEQRHLLWAFQAEVVDDPNDRVFESAPAVRRYHPCVNGEECVGITGRFDSLHLDPNGELYRGSKLPAFFFPDEDYARARGRPCVLCAIKQVQSTMLGFAIHRMSVSSDFAPFQPFFHRVGPGEYNGDLVNTPSAGLFSGLIAPIARYVQSKLFWVFDTEEKRWRVSMDAYDHVGPNGPRVEIVTPSKSKHSRSASTSQKN